MTEPESVPSPARPRRLRWIIGAGLGLFWATYLLQFGPKGPSGELAPPELAPPAKPMRADYDWSILDLDGHPVPFETFRGKAVFLNFWATWCGPCVEELPSIARLANDKRLSDVVFLALSTDEDVDALRKFVREHKVTAPVYLLSQIPPKVFLDPKDPYNLKLPITFLVSPDGRIASIQDGPAQWDDPSVVEFLEKLAKESTAKSGVVEPPRSASDVKH